MSPLNKKIKFTSLELCISKIVGDLLLITMNLLTLIQKNINGTNNNLDSVRRAFNFCYVPGKISS